MTTRRLIASLTASAAVVALAATFAVRSFPLQAQGQKTESNGAPIQIVKGGEHLLHGSLPEYPGRAIERKVEGDVVVDLVLDAQGEVSDARVLSGPDELRKSALESVLQWHYSPSALASTTTQATLRYHLPPPNAEFGGRRFTAYATVDDEKRAVTIREGWAHSAEGQESHELTHAQRTERQIEEIQKALENPETTPSQKDELKQKYAEASLMMEKIRAADREGRVYAYMENEAAGHRIEGSARLAGLRIERVSESVVKEIVAQAGLTVGDTLTEENVKRVRELAASMDEHIRVELGREKDGIILTFITR